MTPETRANLSRYKAPGNSRVVRSNEGGNIMHIKDLRPALVSLWGALAAALCCLLPLGVIALGCSGVFMATTMRYQSMLLRWRPCVTAGYVLYFREAAPLSKLVCTMAGSRVNLLALALPPWYCSARWCSCISRSSVTTLDRAMVSAAKPGGAFRRGGDHC